MQHCKSSPGVQPRYGLHRACERFRHFHQRVRTLMQAADQRIPGSAR
jgi:hypothetical protein